MNSQRLAAEFKAKLAQLGSSLTPIDLLEAYAPHSAALETESLEMKNAVPALENCKYFDRFASPPNKPNGMYANTRGDLKSTYGHDNDVDHGNNSTAAPSKHDYRISEHKCEYLQQHGFVVMSGIHCGRSFGGMYAALCRDGMPVYVTADSVLHAWHKSFRAFYMDLEEDELKPMLELVLNKMLAEVIASGVSESGLVADIRDFLAVALFLISDVRPNVPVSRRVTTIVSAIQEKKTVMILLFERQSEVDFSLLEPRGYYRETSALTRYFQALTWLTMIDFRIGGDGNEAKELHELRCACFLVYFLRKSGVMSKFKMIEDTLDALVGNDLGVESLTPSKLDELLPREFSLIGLCSRRSRYELMKLQRTIRASHQAPTSTAVTSHTRESPRWKKATELLMSFSFFGLHLAWDAFAFSRLVFDKVRYHPSKLVRSMASAVDMTFSVLGNDAATEVLAYRMASRSNERDFARFRDGLPYASNLIALREVLDGEMAKIDPDNCSLSTLWMLALRELARPSAHKAAVFQSDVWKQRMMNTQISSYAQLKRTANLTQSPPVCGIGGGQKSHHPTAFVDPYPAFWDKMQQLATRCAAIPHKIGEFSCSSSPQGPKMERMVEFFFSNFANVMAKLNAISVTQASEIQLTAEQHAFLMNIMEDQSSQGHGSLHGWYPSLFLRNASQSYDHQHEAVAIWKSAPSIDRGDPGGVLHLRVSPTNLCVAVVGTTTFAGPVFTHNEFVATSDLTDKQFLPNAAFVTPDWVRDSFFASTN